MSRSSVDQASTSETRPGSCAEENPSIDDGVREVSTYATRQEALNLCAKEVVAMLRCVEEKQWAWHWSCMDQHAALQRCYLVHQEPPAWARTKVWVSITNGALSARDAVQGALRAAFWGGGGGTEK